MESIKGKWRERCITHYDAKVIEFFNKHFQESNRKCLLIGGAGFDPRSTLILKELANVLGENLTACVIKEERPNPDQELSDRANKNLDIIKLLNIDLKVEKVDIFASDEAVMAGHNIVQVLLNMDFSDYSDIIIDMSALSVGICYPIVKFVYDNFEQKNCQANVHLVLISDPSLDESIKAEPAERPSYVRGFDLPKLSGEARKALLWIPVLSENNQNTLNKIHAYVKPDDTCPILPFPSEDPKKGDRIAFEVFSSIQSSWGGALENDWQLEPHNFIFSDERKPLDIYRTILRIDADRSPVFEGLDGSTILLSPLGSKIPSMGVLLSALEMEFPIVYVEAINYKVDWKQVDSRVDDDQKIVHIWLQGEAYGMSK